MERIPIDRNLFAHHIKGLGPNVTVCSQNYCTVCMLPLTEEEVIRSVDMYKEIGFSRQNSLFVKVDLLPEFQDAEDGAVVPLFCCNCFVLPDRFNVAVKSFCELLGRLGEHWLRWEHLAMVVSIDPIDEQEYVVTTGDKGQHILSPLIGEELKEGRNGASKTIIPWEPGFRDCITEASFKD